MPRWRFAPLPGVSVTTKLDCGLDNKHGNPGRQCRPGFEGEKVEGICDVSAISPVAAVRLAEENIDERLG